MTITFNHPKPAELAAIMAVEHSGFSDAEAATDESMLDRIKTLNDTFVVAYDHDQPIGFIVGAAYDKRYIDDELFEQSTPNEPKAPYQTVLSIAVLPDYQGTGLGSQLLDQLATIAKVNHRQLMSLTCLKQLIPFYERNGYVSEGQSDSQHAGEIWYNMIKPL
ncbi:GNAT family N-acetyltransferase [Lactobacillaceae bacterium Scapto_B20]